MIFCKDKQCEKLFLIRNHMKFFTNESILLALNDEKIEIYHGFGECIVIKHVETKKRYFLNKKSTISVSHHKNEFYKFLLNKYSGI